MKSGDVVSYYNFVRAIAFPSLPKTLGYLFLVPTIGSALAFAVYEGLPAGLYKGALIGLTAFFLSTLISDLLSAWAILKGDPLFYLRRCLALSILSSGLTATILLLVSVAARFDHRVVFPADGFYAALFPAFLVRTLPALSLSEKPLIPRTTFAALQPTLSLVVAALLLRLSVLESITLAALSFMASFLTSALLLLHIERDGITKLGFSPLRILRSFLLNWLNLDNRAVERYFESMGVKSKVEIALIGFRSLTGGRLKCVVVTSGVHPGPFLNAGSSPLPYLTQRVFEERLGAVALVAHGASDHDLNLVSQAQNARFLRDSLKTAGLLKDLGTGTKPVLERVGGGTALCQAFGDVALVSLTLAPDDMEDLPRALTDEIKAIASTHFSHIMVIDAHNSVENPTQLSEEKYASLVEAARKALEACRSAQQYPVRVGVGRALPRGVKISQGLAPAGLTMLLVEVGGERAAYVSIDGNNMVKGLREKILRRLNELGVGYAEVFTTDTHMVNALTPARLGYHPIGEAVEHDYILDLVARAYREAEGNLEPCTASYAEGGTWLKVFGPEAFQRIMGFVYSTAKLTSTAFFASMVLGAALSLLSLLLT